ncbi:TetR/AcrR family transcriptional regulator [Bradyrhizobium guangdongense]|uniref:TetR family transcriptional regulator n=1 Tax=Bradyrhizobium guangdongense TaxID=1325090 RepID=A0A410V625_9BRAD|nr:TetR/AcrR family transcriptional regulator [Bradyrhizobium guangdongense]QAU39135.1 TetR family transcriptional regulator [Bradyrhizobium guangdongense]QOZ60192.1 TetR family transcriptional regulator [Bradyrhizobium guangdongense]GGI26860.1 TetR family transcriptional regulator [Bradyrhizobium guangdongense]
MPKISDKKREDRRQQILEAALACFSEDGFHQTGMADIVKRSGLSHGAVYLYFQSKDELIEALADDRHRREAVLNSVAQGSGHPVEGLHALVRVYAQWLTDPAGEARRRVGIHGWAEALRNRRVRSSVVEGIAMPRALIVALVERGQHDGLIRRDVGADAIARVLIAIFQGFVLQKSWGEDLDVTACMAAVTGVIDGFRTTRPDIKRRART